MKILINLNTSLAKIYQFIKLNNRCVGKIKVYRGEYIVDGKSFLGVLSLDLSEKATVEVNLNDNKDYLDKLDKIGLSYTKII